MATSPEGEAAMNPELRKYLVQHSDFEVGRRIGGGMFGEVYEAVDKRTKALVAVKQLHITKLFGYHETSFYREVQALQGTKSFCLLHLVGFTNYSPFSILTPYMSNGCLYDVIRKNVHLTPTIKTIIAMGIAMAMEELHAKKIMHRDLKSANVLLDGKWRPKVGDFGTAKAESGHLAAMSDKIGSVRWMAPEMLEGKDYDIAVDIYSFGIICWELLTGLLPFNRWKEPDAIPLQVTKGYRPEIPEDTPQPLAAMITAAWASDKMDRPPFDSIVKMFKEGDVAYAGTDHARVCEMYKYFEANSRNRVDPLWEILNEKTHGHFEKAFQTIRLEQADSFLRIVIGHLQRSMTVRELRLLIRGIAKLSLRDARFVDVFVKLRGQHYLPYTEELVISPMAIITGSIIRRHPHLVPLKGITQMLSVVGGGNDKLTILLNLLGQFKLTDPAALEAYKSFASSGNRFLLERKMGLTFLRHMHRMYRHAGHDFLPACRLVFAEAIASSVKEVVLCAYRGICWIPCTWSDVPLDKVVEQLASPEFVLPVARLLSVFSDVPINPVMVQRLVDNAARVKLCSLLLMKLASKNQKFFAENRNWFGPDIMEYRDQLKMILIIISDPTVRCVILSDSRIIDLTARCVNEGNGELVPPLALMIRRLDVTARIVMKFSQNGFLKEMIRMTIMNTDASEDTIHSGLVIIDALARVDFADEYSSLVPYMNRCFGMGVRVQIATLTVVVLLATRYGPITMPHIMKHRIPDWVAQLRLAPQYETHKANFLEQCRQWKERNNSM